MRHSNRMCPSDYLQCPVKHGIHRVAEPAQRIPPSNGIGNDERRRVFNSEAGHRLRGGVVSLARKIFRHVEPFAIELRLDSIGRISRLTNLTEANMIRQALRVGMTCVLLSALTGAGVFAQERGETKAERSQAAEVQPTQARPMRPSTRPPFLGPGSPAQRPFQHTTSQGVTCCAHCLEISSTGACQAWGQCIPNLTQCPVWTN